MFTPRPQGFTMRRVQEYLHRPTDSQERFDADFPVTMRCEACGKFAHGPRSLMREAIAEHKRSDCPARHRNLDEPQVTRIFYPRA